MAKGSGGSGSGGRGGGGVSFSAQGMGRNISGRIPQSGSITQSLGLRNSSEARAVWNDLNSRANSATTAQARANYIDARNRLGAEWGGSYFGF